MKENSKKFISKLKDSYRDIDGKRKNNRKSLINAIKLTKKEIISDLKNIKSKKNLKSTTALLRTIGSSSSWISTSYFQYLTSPVPISKYKISKQSTDQEKDILNRLINSRILEIPYTAKEIFQAIYHDRNRAHQYKSYESKLKVVPPKNITIVLISGVFNELFTTAAFERGAKHLFQKYNIEYLVPNISGIKGHRHNRKIIKDELENYIEKNPTKKLWLISYSKGGIDTLYFLRKHKEFSNRYIWGLSTIASPILGTDHFNKRLMKLVKNSSISKEMFELDSSRREGWFRRNYHELPDNLFYTSLAFVADWHESHLSMMLAKIVLSIDNPNDGMIDVENAHFPEYFNGINLGEVKGHHLSGTRGSSYSQEALVESLLIFLTHL